MVYMPDKFELTRNGPRKIDGTALTEKDLPPPTWPPGAKKDEYRWTSEDKANVVAAIRSGLISTGEAFKRWRLSPEEYLSWDEALRESGKAGLAEKGLYGVEYDLYQNPKRKEAEDPGEVLKTGPFALFSRTRRVTCGQFEIVLGPQEWALFNLLISKTGSIVSHVEILQVGATSPTARIGDLRNKLAQISGGRNWIKNYLGQGWLYSGANFIDQ